MVRIGSRCAELGLSLSAYLQQIVQTDLDRGGAFTITPRPPDNPRITKKATKPKGATKLTTVTPNDVAKFSGLKGKLTSKKKAKRKR